jgi:hypothetical protein
MCPTVPLTTSDAGQTMELAMTNDSGTDNRPRENKPRHHSAHWDGGVYGFGFIGAAIYFIQHATTFWMGVYGVLKAMVWPAILVYKALQYLGM